MTEIIDTNTKRARFRDATWAQKPNDVLCLVAGQGGIGGWLTLLLSRIGYVIITYDHDIFEDINMSGQMMVNGSTNMAKGKAVKLITRSFGCDNEIYDYHEKFTNETPGQKFMFSAFDNMEARKNMFNAWFEYNKNQGYQDAIFIDGRLSLESFQIFCVTPQHTKRYREEFLFDDSEVQDEACTLKQTTHTATMIASFMTGFFTNHLTNLATNNKARKVPFITEYFLPLNLFEDVHT